MAESATFALKAGVWFRRGRLLIASPDSLGTACPLSGRNSTYRPVQISAAGSIGGSGGDRGLRNWVTALDPRTGEIVWKTYSIPAPGEPGNETWKDNHG